MNFSERLAAVQAEIAAQGLDAFLVPRADEHLGEYAPPCAERLAWLTGFTGSAGLAAVLPHRSVIWSDGRYVLQLAAQTDAALWEALHLTEQPPPAWLAGKLAAGAGLGYDPWLMSEEQLARFRAAGLTLVPVTRNPVDAVWVDRPTPPLAAAVPHALEFAGVGAAEKRAEIAAMLRDAKQDAAVVSDPASLAWLLNIRGADLDFCPFALGFALVHADAGVELFMAPEKLSAETRAWLGNGVAAASPAALAPALTKLVGKRVRVDEAGTAAWFADRLREAGAEIIAGPDPCLLPKARKNATEQQGARRAHLRDAAPLCRFLHWAETAGGHETEMSAAGRLLALRADLPEFRGESFPAISGAGEHGAIMHYRVTPETDRRIGVNEVYLIDSGAQFADGTTDVTRTVWTGPDAPPEEIRDRFTRVLKGHIAIATLVFPENVGGARLDAFARAALWQVGLDYDHGTGHGVGSYLSVHEGPAGISPLARPVPIEAGMILSNEPGFYLPGGYGIRLENLVLVRESAVSGTKKFLEFETLTLAPFDRRLILPELLTGAERHWLDAYHARVLTAVSPALSPDVAAWLADACAPIGMTHA